MQTLIKINIKWMNQINQLINKIISMQILIKINIKWMNQINQLINKYQKKKNKQKIINYF